MQRLWLEEVASDIKLPQLSKNSSQKVLDEVEAAIKAVIQLSYKLQRRAKKNTMTVEDVNLALAVLNVEKVYGLMDAERQGGSGAHSTGDESVAVVMGQRKVDLATYASRLLPQYPLLPEAHFHWLAIAGAQPIIPQNPEVVVYDCAADTSGLPREMAFFYTQLTQLVLSATSTESAGKSVVDACLLLRRDSGLQALVGYLSRFVFVHIRRNLKKTHTLHALLQVIHSLVLNPKLNLESCLHQLLPSLLSCIVGAKIGDPTTKDVLAPPALAEFPVGCCSIWSELQPFHVRNFGAFVVQAVLARYGDTFPDLLPRVCKTYLQAAFTSTQGQGQGQGGAAKDGLSRHVSGAAAVRYGGIVGLGMLGERVISDVLLPNINTILQNVKSLDNEKKEGGAGAEDTAPSAGLIGRRGGGGGGAQQPLWRQRDFGGDYVEEDLLVSIINWHIRRRMASLPSLDYFYDLKAHLVPPYDCAKDDSSSADRKRRRLVGTAAHACAGWDDFAERNIEKFVPPYVALSSNLNFCTNLFI